MPYKLLHIGDVHLDAAFAGHDPHFGRKRRRQLEAAFERALALARQRGVDAVCIAGDLYEKNRSGPDRGAYLKRKLGELAPVRVFVSPGNHDPYTGDSLYRLMEPLPDNVTVFGSRAMRRERLTDDLSLWGCAHERDTDFDPIIRSFACEGPGTHLLLFHGSDEGNMPPNKEKVAPFAAADVARSGAAHAMVGHFHGMLAHPGYAYTGSLEPLNPAQTGRHTACIVTMEDGRVGLEFADVNATKYVAFDFDVSPYASNMELVAALLGRIRGAVTRPGDVFCRVHLVGAAASTLELEPSEVEADLARDFPGLELKTGFAAFDLDAIAREGRTVRASFVKELSATARAVRDGERSITERALRLGLLAFAKKPLRP